MATQILIGDATERLRGLAGCSVHCCVTSPPYFGLRDYGVAGQLGGESDLDEYLAKLVTVFREVKRVLRDDGTLWLNMGDSYAHNGPCGGGSPVDARSPEYGRKGYGSDASKGRETDRTMQRLRRPKFTVPPKSLLGAPWRLAFALQSDGWVLRQDIIWDKVNPLPEAVRDRCTKSHEYMFLLAKSPKYYFDHEAMREPAACAGQRRGGSTNRYEGGNQGADSKIYNTRNRRSIWRVLPDRKQKGQVKHFATFPPALIEPCIKASVPPGGTVLDPFGGSGTTAQVAESLGRNAILIELNEAYRPLIEARLRGVGC